MKILLNDGTEYPVNWCGAADGVLTASLAGKYEIPDLALAFGDPEAVARIEFQYGEMCDIFEGFTRLVGLQLDGWGSGSALVSLERGTAV